MSHTFAMSWLELGLVEHASGNLDLAAANLRRARRAVADDPKERPLVDEIDVSLARVVGAQGRGKEAHTLLASVAENLRRIRPPGHPELVEIETEIARLSARFGPYR